MRISRRQLVGLIREALIAEQFDTAPIPRGFSPVADMPGGKEREEWILSSAKGQTGVYDYNNGVIVAVTHMGRAIIWIPSDDSGRLVTSSMAVRNLDVAGFRKSRLGVPSMNRTA